MSLRLHDTATRSVRDFVPLEPGKVSMYQCGATVQSDPHVGHLRCGIVFDVLRRWLTRRGYEVTLVRNVTDIDDKILLRAIEEQRPWWAVAAHYERAFQRAYELLGCLPPTIEPRATGHITQMLELVDRLIANGHAYEVAGSVYFDVRSFANYGHLSGQRLAELQPASDADPATTGEKRDPRDFAIWKATKPGEPSWPTTFGRGRPGWHLECSAMAVTYLGREFDIHGGGLDLVFPHHENEIAQAQGAGDPFARLWLHNAWVTTAGEKMSKSLGNSLIVDRVLEHARPIELRWYMISAHYRSNLEFSPGALREAAASFRRIEGFLGRAARVAGAATVDLDGELPEAFSAAMDDDLSVPAAIAVVQNAVTAGNTALAAGEATSTREHAVAVRRMLSVLGVDPLSSPWSVGANGDDTAHRALDALVRGELDAREAARAARDYATADAIRNRLSAAGIRLEDGAGTSRWTLEDQ